MSSRGDEISLSFQNSSGRPGGVNADQQYRFSSDARSLARPAQETLYDVMSHVFMWRHKVSDPIKHWNREKVDFNLKKKHRKLIFSRFFFFIYIFFLKTRKSSIKWTDVGFHRMFGCGDDFFFNLSKIAVVAPWCNCGLAIPLLV